MCFSAGCVSGAYAGDWSRWRNLLYNLYDALIREISQISSRGKYAAGSRHVAVKEALIELTAHICHQVRLRQRAGGAARTCGRPLSSVSVHVAVR